MPIYHYLEYKSPLMMHEGTFASLKLLRDSFLFIKRINLTVDLTVSSIPHCIPPWIKPTVVKCTRV